MQLTLPLSSPPPDVVFVRHRRARRFIIRVLDDGTVRLTMPRWGARHEALAFLEASREWIEQQRVLRRAAGDRRGSWRHGTKILIDGEPVRLEVSIVRGAVLVMAAGEEVARGAALDALDVRQAVEGWLRRRAVRELVPALLVLARQCGIEVPRVSVRDQRSRWGACTRRGSITLNWRLVQVPPFVRTYVMLHELMHRRELNHSRRFWRHVAAVCPRYQDARRWLLTQGRDLF